VDEHIILYKLTRCTTLSADIISHTEAPEVVGVIQGVIIAGAAGEHYPEA